MNLYKTSDALFSKNKAHEKVKYFLSQQKARTYRTPSLNDSVSFCLAFWFCFFKQIKQKDITKKTQEYQMHETCRVHLIQKFIQE